MDRKIIILLIILVCFLAGCKCDDCCPPNEVCPPTNCIEPIPTEDCSTANVILGTSRKEINDRCGEAPIAMRNNNMVIYKYTNNEVSRDLIFYDNEVTYDTRGE